MRHALAALLPIWAQRAYGRSFTTEGAFTLYDYDNAIMRDMLLARFPSYAPEDALPLILRDRGLIAGPYESIDAQRARALLWIDQAQLRGLPVGLMLAIQAYLAPAYPQIRIVTRRGIWYTLAEGTVGRILGLPGYTPLPPCSYELGANWPAGSRPMPQIERARNAGLYTRHKPPAINWDWDSISNPENADRWWHFWIVVYPPSYPFQEGYDTGWIYDDPLESWGFDEPTGTLQTFKAIVRGYKPAKSRCVAIVACPSLSDFSPTALPADPTFPDGYWGWEVKLESGEWVNTRRLDCRYAFLGANE